MPRRRTSSLVKKVALLAVIAGSFGIGILLIWAATLKLPDFSAFGERKVIESTKIYDRTGTVLLWDVHENVKRTVVPFSEISRHAKNAIVAIEDTNFYNHRGVDPRSIAQVFLENLTSKTRRGASTITQQLVKNALLTGEKTYTRKLKEAVLAIKIERELTKEEILDLYLNEIPYGGSIYGVEAASQNFFGKRASELSLAESAYLAALPQAPTYYSPYGNHAQELEERKNLVLRRMVQLDFITERELDEAMRERVAFIPRGDQSIKAPHFSTFVRSYLEETYGKDAVERDGLRVTTTLDWSLQATAEVLLKKHVENTTKQFNATNAGLIAVDPKTGHVLAMVGSKDFFDTEHEGNFNVTLAHRQPGSSFKPFVYAAALAKGYTDETVVFDLKTEFSSACNADGTPAEGAEPDACYSPDNYDNVFRGPVTFREALAQSINVPSVKVLYLVGLDDALAVARSMGISSLNDPARYGLTLVLGGGEVSLLELTGAYAVFANDGVRNAPSAILRVEDRYGKVLEEHRPTPSRVVDEQVARTISDILSDNEARSPAFGEQSFLYFGSDRQVAAKTGTTNDYRDAWVLGYTPDLAVGVWFGNNDNSPMEKRVAGFIAAPLWNEFFREAFKTIPNTAFSPPIPHDARKPVLRGEWRGGHTYTVDALSGKLATEYTPPELREERSLVEVHSILHWVDRRDPRGPIPVSPSRDPQYRLWERPVRLWAAARGMQDQTAATIPKEFDDLHRPEYAPRITVSSPAKNGVYNPQGQLVVVVSWQARFGLSQIDYFLNNQLVGSTRGAPFRFSFIPGSSAEMREQSDLKVVAYDAVRNKTTVNVPIVLR
ncbi:MAG: PBP1A family penicillin-binding protein [Parcubacteria group bacterium]|nr:PBP1A family penicillin-binding protein [Parcubacteria group bacterium]